ncbi:MmgE/PrpD family protein [Candidimonas humi]|uniref:MmgE/PrpD family protein n=1 Tax=Candidimonas humi TaxID=683355 RepID=A0ABV8P419_9BURK|nr:MmgE/PrpD family protein [Candidimonas humi]MBV6306927.1 MmgE/PrpD family protein [Candidimonas humi]
MSTAASNTEKDDTAALRLARFAAGLRLADVPAEVRARARACIADALACAVYGSRFPWSAATAAYARRYGGQGPCTLLDSGPSGSAPGVAAPAAAFANACSAHAFEQDSLRFPGAGVHPGAVLVPALAAACQETGASGERALLAFVAACEVLFRIGAASRHSSEALGFHAPGLTGPYGAAVAAGLIYGLDAEQLAHALGIAGSMSGGLLAFTKARRGATVKRLHMGRASEAGIVAARLASEGYGGPETIFEGRYGFLDAYCREAAPALLTDGLGSNWETLKICIKRYPCHVTAQPTMQCLRGLMAEHGFGGEDVARLELECSPKVASHHDIREPGDVMKAQYSVPFCAALALYRDPENPDSFDESALRDPGIARLCRQLELRSATDLPTAWSARIAIELRDGRRLQAQAEGFKGMPGTPLSDDELEHRFLLLTHSALGAEPAAGWYARLAKLEAQPGFPMPA